ncbi:cytochrome c biogenesis protein ResB [Candidatus Sumerlaeota bacterium]|nr:cytochrome c biogenesis protein ResB [Candidatus Sumerlaeota bacterium]
MLRTLASVKLGVTLLLLLALATIVGTFVESVYDTATAQRLIYHSIWFIALMAATAVNLTVSTWEILRRVLNVPGSRPVPDSETVVRTMPRVRELAMPSTPERVAAVIERHVGHVSARNGGVFAQRGIAQRWGVIVTHAGILLLLAGGIALTLMARVSPPGGRMIWLGEGMTRDWYLAPSPENPRFSAEVPMPFTLRLHDFDADFFPNTNVPRRFTSFVELTAPDGSRSFHTVNMNVALRWRGWKFSQASYAILNSGLEPGMRDFFLRMDRDRFADLIRRGRLAIRLTDTRTGAVLPDLDAGVGARASVPLNDDLTFETPDGLSFLVRRGEEVIGSGPLGGLESTALGGSWSARVEALYPNYRRGAAGHSTEGDAMTNPAVRWTLLRDGVALGSDLAFSAESFRAMHFTDLPIQAQFEGYEPADLAEWREGDEIALRLRFTDESTDQTVATAMARVGEVFDLDVGDDSPAQAMPDQPAVGPHTAQIVGTMPAAYSGLSVMRESMRIKIFFYVAFLLFLGGPLMAFSLTHLRVMAWVDPSTGRVTLGGRARGNRLRLDAALDRIADDLAQG